MKLPVTRESLRTFDPAKEKKDKDDIAIQNHINLLVQGIADTIENRMSWTMPKAGGVVIPKSLITNAKRAHEAMMNDKRFIWDGVRNIKSSGSSVIDVNESILIPLLVQKLKENFIGCDITVDPLRTYIIIDWS